MYSTRTTRWMSATPAEVYAALLDPEAVARWRVPDGMTSEVHEFDPQVGGRFRISLTYDADDQSGKSAGRTDTYHGYFAVLDPDHLVVEKTEFEAADPALQGVMTMSTELHAVDDGCEVIIVHDDIPDAVAREDNEAGTQMALTRLANLVERHPERLGEMEVRNDNPEY